MDKEIMNIILGELDHFRAERNQAYFKQLHDDFEPLQFVELDEFKMEKFLTEEETLPCITSVAFVMIGEEYEDCQEYGIGVWNIIPN